MKQSNRLFRTGAPSSSPPNWRPVGRSLEISTEQSLIFEIVSWEEKSSRIMRSPGSRQIDHLDQQRWRQLWTDARKESGTLHVTNTLEQYCNCAIGEINQCFFVLVYGILSTPNLLLDQLVITTGFKVDRKLSSFNFYRIRWYLSKIW